MCDVHVLPNRLIFNLNQLRLSRTGGDFQAEGEGISDLHVLPNNRIFYPNQPRLLRLG